jgi:hypothetical protein
MNDDEPSTRELDRRFDRLERSITAGFDKIDARLDRMVSSEMFSMFQQNNEQRLTAVEKDATEVDGRCLARRDQLQSEIDQVERSRAEDRRMVIKSTVAFAATILAALISAVISVVLFLI